VRDVVVSPQLTIPAAELGLAFARSGGPGGQNVNKVSSKVELRWHAAGSPALAALGDAARAWVLERLRSRLTTDGTLIVTSTATRDQLGNREDALAKLAVAVAAALARPKPRRATRPSRGAKRKRLADKRHHAEKKASRRGGAD
jgi:ribosome-associated protein